ncbi:MAG: DUF4178 domain-containing protein [Verrucomicrobia subdivision 3 bacterium]|nr:DUF4178 domain-containing protein [Verrucomicrobiota bacterium]MCC6820794.1 DUF4178 domain-containing protein [Limisphaerales bacterium]
MNFANPTPIKVGMAGTFSGRRFRVAGRVVMGMDEGGETYYWNEFNLVADDGQSVTLVFEVGERGPEWRMFTLFEPEFSMTAADAATRRIGDRLNLEGTDLRVTLVDESRVYHIEGEAPVGVEVGDGAHYFNAQAGKDMVVVSWTGDEVEYYRGVDLAGGTVTAAFNLSSQQLSDFHSASIESNFLSSSSFATDPEAGSKRILQIALAVLLAGLAFAGYTSCRTNRQPMPVVKLPAPPSPLNLGSEGMLDGKSYRISRHILMEIAQVGRVFERHEYQLLAADGAGALLICGLKSGDQQWGLFTPLNPLQPMTPPQAANLRVGDAVEVDGYEAIVCELVQFTVQQVETSEPSDLQPPAIGYSFTAETNKTLLLTRWKLNEISFHRGRVLTTKEVTGAFRANENN